MQKVPSNKKMLSVKRSPVLQLGHPRLSLPRSGAIGSDRSVVFDNNLSPFQKALSSPETTIAVGFTLAQSQGLVQDIGGYSHLDWILTVLKWDQAARQAKVDAVLVGLRGIAIHDDGSFHKIFSKFIDIWPDILEWMIYIWRKKCSNSDNEERVHVRDTIAAALYVMVRNSKLADLMISDPDAHDLVYKLWLSFPGKPSLEASGGVPVVPWLCFFFLDSLPKEGPPQLQLLLDAAGGDINSIAKAACAPLHAEYDLSTPESQSLLHHHMRMFTLFRGIMKERDGSVWRTLPTHPLVNALVDVQCIELHVKALVQVAQLYREGGKMYIIDHVAFWFDFTCFLAEAPVSHRGILLALRGGILSAFVVMSPHVPRIPSPIRKGVTQLLSEILPSFLIYQPVIQACHEFLENITPDGEARVMNSVMAEPWKEFRAIVAERHAIPFTPKPNSASSTICASVKCSQFGFKTEFSRCKSCLVTMYCSKECQIQDWKEGGHKAACKKEAKKDLESGGYRHFEKDLRFIEQLVEHETRKHKEHLRAEAEAKLRQGMTLGSLMVSFDYTVSPRKLAVEPIQNLFHEDYGLKFDKYSFTRDLSIGCKGKLTILEIIYANGGCNAPCQMLAYNRDFWKELLSK